MSKLKIDGARLHSITGKGETGSDEDYWKGKAVFNARLTAKAAEDLNVIGAYNDRVDFTIPRKRFLEEFCGENSCASVKFRLTGGDMAMSVSPVSIHAAPVKYLNDEHTLKLTITFDEHQYRALSEFGAQYKKADGYLEIAPIQAALPFDQPKKAKASESAEEGETEAVEKPKRGRPRKDAVDPVVAAGAAKGGANGASASLTQ